jgi:hypothetical protein
MVRHNPHNLAGIAINGVAGANTASARALSDWSCSVRNRWRQSVWCPVCHLLLGALRYAMITHQPPPPSSSLLRKSPWQMRMMTCPPSTRHATVRNSHLGAFSAATFLSTTAHGGGLVCFVLMLACCCTRVLCRAARLHYHMLTKLRRSHELCWKLPIHCRQGTIQTEPRGGAQQLAGRQFETSSSAHLERQVPAPRAWTRTQRPEAIPPCWDHWMPAILHGCALPMNALTARLP